MSGWHAQFLLQLRAERPFAPPPRVVATRSLASLVEEAEPDLVAQGGSVLHLSPIHVRSLASRLPRGLADTVQIPLTAQREGSGAVAEGATAQAFERLGVQGRWQGHRFLVAPADVESLRLEMPGLVQLV